MLWARHPPTVRELPFGSDPLSAIETFRQLFSLREAAPAKGSRSVKNHVLPGCRQGRPRWGGADDVGVSGVELVAVGEQGGDVGGFDPWRIRPSGETTRTRPDVSLKLIGHSERRGSSVGKGSGMSPETHKMCRGRSYA